MMSDKTKKIIFFSVAAVFLVAVVFFVTKCISGRNTYVEKGDEQMQQEAALIYGIPYENYDMEEDVIASGQSISVIFARYGVGASTVDKVAKASEEVFPLKNIRAGHKYTVFLAQDSTRRLEHFVYEQSLTDYVVISLEKDTVQIRKEQKDVTVERRKASATISSSLWNCCIEAGMPAAMTMELSEIYAWAIDFFGLQAGDHFTVVYDEKFVDSTRVGTGMIWGCIFNHSGKDYYAIPYKQGEKVTYWDENGNSLRKNLLKAPLKFSRISSKFSNSRLHPVLKIRRPHHGVDYAAPSGTPVVAVADGVVTHKGWAGGGGNTVKIKHPGNLMSGYLHLSKYGPGIAVGKRVSQGDVIGYVGSTGVSTGPHLDFRLWRGGTAIDPLKAPSEPAEPIAAANKASFESVRDRIIAEIKGEVAPDQIVTQLDSVVVSTAAAAADSVKTK